MAFFLSPICNDQQTDANGNPLVGGKVFTYLAGSSTPAATYTDATGATPQANPIILNSLGLPASPIWLTGGVSYKFVIKTAADVTVRTVDNVSGINDVSSTAQEWNESGLVPTYLNATQFSVPGDQTAVLQVNRRLRNKVTAGYAYGRISASVFSAGVTTVTMVNDGTTLDSGLTSVAYGFLSYTPSSVPYALYAGAGANTDIDSLKSTVVSSKIQPILATVNASAMTVTLNPTRLDFRNTTLSSGTTFERLVPTAITLVIPSGATLGTVNAVASRIAIVAIDNSGTVELAAVNYAGNLTLDETGVINTTAISGAASSASTVYSTTARTGVAYRLVGYVDSTQATAGTWATSPSLVQGIGGMALVPKVFSGGTGAVATTSGTTVVLTTQIPANVSEFTVHVDGVSTNGSSITLIQAGTSGGYVVSGYNQNMTYQTGASGGQSSSTAGIAYGSAGAAAAIYGNVTFRRMGNGLNKWSVSGVTAYPVAGFSNMIGGVVDLGAEVTSVRLNTVGGTDTHDAGNAYVTWKGPQA